MILPQIKFSKCPIEPRKGESWDKLKHPKTGVEFTTYRGYKWRKWNYYKVIIDSKAQFEGQTYEVIEAGRILGEAVLMGVDSISALMVTQDDIRTDTFQNITHPIAFWQNLIVKFYKRADVMLIKLTFKWTCV